MSANITINPELPIRKMEQKVILDIRTFLPCHAKEVEEWSWRKAKNEKWIVHLQHNGKLRKWKLVKD